MDKSAFSEKAPHQPRSNANWSLGHAGGEAVALDAGEGNLQNLPKK
jgi:hypothetical protein